MPKRFTRREVLSAALASPIVAATARFARAQKPPLPELSKTPGRIVTVDGAPARQVELVRRWRGSLCNSRLVNHGRNSVRIKEVVLCETALKPESRLNSKMNQ
jgi:hypothetical protein